MGNTSSSEGGLKTSTVANIVLGVFLGLFIILFIAFVVLYSQTKSRPASCPICTVSTCQSLGCTPSSPCPSCAAGTTTSAALASTSTGTTATTPSTIPASVTLNTFDGSGCPNQTYIPLGTYLSYCNGVQYDPSSNTLYASCRDPSTGTWSSNALKLDTCALGSDITLTSGALSCPNTYTTGSYWLPSCTTTSPNSSTINVVPGGSWFEANCSNFAISGNMVTATCSNTDISQSLLNGSNCTWVGNATLNCAAVVPSQTVTSPIPL